MPKKNAENQQRKGWQKGEKGQERAEKITGKGLAKAGKQLRKGCEKAEKTPIKSLEKKTEKVRKSQEKV